MKQLEEDLYDGQVLQKLLGESTGVPSKRLQWGHPGEDLLCMVAWVKRPEGRLRAASLRPCSQRVAPGLQQAMPNFQNCPMGMGRWGKNGASSSMGQPSCLM